MTDAQTEARKELELALLAQQGGPTASPSVPYIKYITEDSYVPNEIPAPLRAVAQDKEMGLTNLTPVKSKWLMLQLRLAEIAFSSSRPALAGNWNERIILATLPAKQLIKLSRSEDGGFERRMQVTQMQVRQAFAGGAPPTKGRKWGIFGKQKEVAPT